MDSFNIVFQGDSITDAGRDRSAEGANDPAAMGMGYALLAMCRWLAERPRPNARFYNRGISGNKVLDLSHRWQEDCLELQPRVVSILVGINDLWHKLDGAFDGSPHDYERDYEALLDRTRGALPEARLVVGEPFVLKTGVVDERWFPEFEERRAIAEDLAKRHGATWVPFHQTFLRAVAVGTDPAHWAEDGVHPTPAGHYLMADAWWRAVNGRPS